MGDLNAFVNEYAYVGLLLLLGGYIAVLLFRKLKSKNDKDEEI